MTATGFAVHLAGVRKTFRPGNAAPVTAVDDASLDLASGDTAALTGPSGSGKSTLLHLIGAIDAPDAGAIEVGGTVITSLGGGRLAECRATVGFVFQKFNLLLALNAEHGTTMIIATHDPAIAGRCQRVIRMRDGQMTTHPEPSVGDDARPAPLR